MVKIVIDANRPMKYGLLLLLVAIAIFVVHAVTGEFAWKYAAVSVGILGFIVYAIGRIQMLWKRRY